MEECIIIGGGVAGLSAANQLADLGISSLLIEAGSYPGHRICGEFFSPECLPILEKWEIPLSSTIRRCCFMFKDKEIAFNLPQAAKGESRYQFDMNLLERARRKGVTVLTDSPCAGLRPPDHKEGYYVAELSNGAVFKSKTLIVGTGKLPALTKSKKPPSIYGGYKAHFKGIEIEDDLLEMHCFKGGYLGISPIAPGIVNLACLARLDQASEPAFFMKKVLAQKGMEKLAERIARGQMLYDRWMFSSLPEFGLREIPNLPNTYWIGDAAGSIPPVCGDGLGIAITTGIMAAEYFVRKDAEGFRRDWLQRYRKRFFWGKYLHKVVMQPMLCHAASLLCRAFPFLPQNIFWLTREHSS